MKNFHVFSGALFTVVISVLFLACNQTQVSTINIGYIGPITTRAVDLGIGPSKALLLAVDEYNASKKDDEPTVNLFIEDDQWEKDKALPAYLKLRKEHNIDILFISNTDGTIALQDKIVEDKVILVNPLNSDELLSSLNQNTFKIAKETEGTNAMVGRRIVELGLKKALILHFPNDFMTRAARSVEEVFNTHEIDYTTIEVEKGDTDFVDILEKQKDDSCEAYVFFGYRNFGYAMKQMRAMGIDNKMFGSTTLMDPMFYKNSDGTITGTEFPFFTATNGNYILAKEFLEKYSAAYGEKPNSDWPAFQAYDAGNMVLQCIQNVNRSKKEEQNFDDWLRKEMHKLTYYQGVCGNISIDANGASKGIYFSLYKYISEGNIEKLGK